MHLTQPIQFYSAEMFKQKVWGKPGWEKMTKRAGHEKISYKKFCDATAPPLWWTYVQVKNSNCQKIQPLSNSKFAAIYYVDLNQWYAETQSVDCVEEIAFVKVLFLKFLTCSNQSLGQDTPALSNLHTNASWCPRAIEMIKLIISKHAWVSLRARKL